MKNKDIILNRDCPIMGGEISISNPDGTDEIKMPMHSILKNFMCWLSASLWYSAPTGPLYGKKYDGTSQSLRANNVTTYGTIYLTPSGAGLYPNNGILIGSLSSIDKNSDMYALSGYITDTSATGMGFAAPVVEIYYDTSTSATVVKISRAIQNKSATVDKAIRGLSLGLPSTSNLNYYAILTHDIIDYTLSASTTKTFAIKLSFDDGWNRNFPNFLWSAIQYPTNTVVSMTGTDGNTFVAERSQAWYIENEAYNRSTYGIVVGTGTAAATPTDYKLVSQISSTALFHQISALYTPTLTGDNVSYTTTLSRLFTNTTGSNITIGEIGIYAYKATSPAKYSMLFRQALASPVTLAPTESAEFFIDMMGIYE